MELRVLRYFLGVVRCGTVTAAARALHITQPTLTRQLHELEEELRQRLFSQVGRQLRLTPAGQRLRQRAEEMLALAQQTRSELLSLGDELSGEVFIGAGESSAMREVAERIAAFRQRYPKIRFHLYSGNAEEILSRLDHGLLDFGVLIQPVDTARYESRPLAERATWGLILRRDHPLAAKRTICRAVLPGLPLLCPRPMLASAPVRNPCLDWLDGKTEALTIVGSYNLLYNAAQLVETGTVCAIGLDHLLGNRDLCFRPFLPAIESAVDIVWRKFRPFSNGAALFLERLQT